MGFLLGVAAGGLWMFGAVVTHVYVAWTGPISLLIVGWPVIAVVEVIGQARNRAALRK